MRFSGISYINAPHKFMWRTPFEGIWHDVDGTLSGTGVANTEVVPTSDLLDPAACTEQTVTAAGGLSTSFCQGVTIRRFSGNQQAPSSLTSTDLWVRRLSDNVDGSDGPGPWQYVPLLFKGSPTHTFGYMFAVTMNKAYELRWDLQEFERVDLESFKGSFYSVEDGEAVWFVLDHWTWEALDPLDRPLYTARVESSGAGVAADTTIRRAGGLDLAADTFSPSPRLIPVPDLVGASADGEAAALWYADVKTHLNQVTGETTPAGAWLSWGVAGCSGTSPYCTRSFDLTVSPCPFEGCWPPPPPPPAPEAEEGSVSWCDPETWVGLPNHLGNPMNFVNSDGELVQGQDWAGAVPAAGDNVWIPAGVHVAVDCDLSGVVFGRVVVQGTLTMSKSLDVVTLEAEYIEIKGGTLQAGSAESPFPDDKRAVIRLHGHRHSVNLVFGREIFVQGAKSLGVFGKLALFGSPRAGALTWAALADGGAPASGTTASVQADLTGWVAGDEVVLTPTGYHPDEAEKRTLAADPAVTIAADGTATSVLTFTEALQYSHTASTETHGSRSMEMRGHVGLLSRNVVVEGALENVDPITGTHTGYGRLNAAGELAEDSGQEFGVSIVAGRYTDVFEDGTRLSYVGTLQLDHVEVRYGGQNGFDDRFAVGMAKLKSDGASSFVTSCAIHSGFHTALGVSQSNDVTVTDNVIYRSVGSAVVAVRTTRLMLARNLVTQSFFLGGYLVNAYPAESFRTTACVLVEMGADAAVVGNVAAGCDRAAFRVAGRSCTAAPYADDERSLVFKDNVAYAALFGLFANPPAAASQGCHQFHGFTAWRCWDFGVFAEHHRGEAWFEGTRLADNGVGAMVHVVGASPLQHQREDSRVRFVDTLLLAASSTFTCDMRLTKPRSMCRAKKSHCFGRNSNHVGMYMPIFNSQNNHAPNISPWWGIGHYPAIGGKTVLDGMTMAGFTGDRCGKRDIGFTLNPMTFDHVHEAHVSGFEAVGSDHDSLVVVPPLVERLINQDDCIDMDCDGMKTFLLVDEDGSMLGAPGSVTGRADDFSPSAVGAKLPAEMVTTPDGELLTEEAVVPNGYGYVWPASGCFRDTAWAAEVCSADTVRHTTMVIESMDVDTEIRRLSPVAVSAAGFTQLVNGPADHGWCFDYTCLKRISTFYPIVAVGQRHEVYLTSTNPAHTRLHLINAGPDDAVVVSIYYSTANRLNVFLADTDEYVEDMNMVDGVFKQQLVREGKWPSNQADGSGWTNEFPTAYHRHGTNAFNRVTRTLDVVLRGDRPLDIRVMPVVQVSMSLAVSVEDFYEAQDDFVSNLAFVLGIPAQNIFIVSVVPGSAVVDFEVAAGPVVAFVESSATVVESSGVAVISLQRTENILGNVTVTYTVTEDGTAAPGTHFTPASGALYFPSQVATATIEVPVLYDSGFLSSPVSVVVQLSNATSSNGATLGSVSSFTLFISNVDPPAPSAPSVSAASASALAAEWTVPEWTGGDAADVAVTSVELQAHAVASGSWSTVYTLDAGELDGSYTLTGLGTYTAHEFRVRTGNGVAWSAWSATSAAVHTFTVCGDGVREGSETCDIGFRVGQNNTGCSAACQVAVGFSCSYDADVGADVCEAGCGDSIKAGAEECDGSSGCSDACRVLPGWTCDANGENCATVCGDSIIAGAEVCDVGSDATAAGFGGCAADCTSVTAGWTCDTVSAVSSGLGTTSSSRCHMCGNGLVETPEVCDDGNGANGDGCSSACTLEAGFVCSGGSTASADVCVGGPGAIELPPSVSDVRETTVRLSWGTPHGNGLNVTSFTVEVQQHAAATGSFAGQPWTVAMQSTALPPPTSAQLANLTDGTTYRFRVYAATSAGPGAPSPESLAVTTVEVVEPSLTTVADTLVNVTSSTGSVGGIDVGGIDVAAPTPAPTPPPVVEEVDVTDPDFDPSAFENVTVVQPSPSPSPAPPAVVELGQGEFSFVDAAVTVQEGAGDVAFAVQRLKGAFSTVEVTWNMTAVVPNENVTAAVLGQDVTVASGVLTFPFNDLVETVTVSIPDVSASWSPDRAFRVQLTGTTGTATLGPVASVLVTVTDKDPAPVMSVDAVPAVTEFVGTFWWHVRRPSDASVAYPCSVSYTVEAGSDTVEGTHFVLPANLSSSGGSFAFVAGEAVKSFPVTVVPDEPSDQVVDRTVTLSLLPDTATGGVVDADAAASTATVTYHSCDSHAANPCPVVALESVTRADVTEPADDSTVVVTVHVARSENTDRAVTINAVLSHPRADADAAFVRGDGRFVDGVATLEFGAGVTRANFSLEVVADGLDEAVARQVSVQLSSPTGGATVGSASTFTMAVQYMTCAELLDCATPVTGDSGTPQYRGVRFDVTIGGVSVAEFDRAAYAASVAAALGDTDAGLDVLPTAVEVLSVEAVSTAARRRQLASGVAVDTMVTSRQSDAAAQSEATLMSTTVSSGAFSTALQNELQQATDDSGAAVFASATVSAVGSGAVVNAPTSAPLPSPSPTASPSATPSPTASATATPSVTPTRTASSSTLPIKSVGSNTSTIVIASIACAVVLVAAGACYFKFTRVSGAKVHNYKSTVRGLPGTAAAGAGAGAGAGEASNPLTVTSYYPWRCTLCGYRNAAQAPKCEVCRRGIPPMREGRRVAPTRALSPGASNPKLFTRVSTPSPSSSRNDLRVEEHE